MTAFLLDAATPAVVAESAGQPLPGRPDVLGVRVARRLSAPAQCELVLHDPDGQALDLLGAPLSVRLGSDPHALFVGEVTAVDASRGGHDHLTTRVRAYDVMHRLRKRQTLRVLEDVTAADVAAALTADLGLRVVAGAPGPRFERIVQHRHRDLELLVATLARVGLHFVLEADPAAASVLRLVTLEGHGSAVPLRYGAELQQARVSANLDRAATQCTAFGWHPQRAEPLRAQATEPRGAEPERRPRPDRVGVTGHLSLLDQSGRDIEEIRAVAQAALDTAAARSLVLTGTVTGGVRLAPGRPVRISGVAASVDGEHVLTETTSTVDGMGHRVELSTQPPDRPVAPWAASLTLGRVIAVDDPDGCGRVQVSLPAYGDLDAGWLSVLCPGAGSGKGLVALPDAGDTVLVALPHDAPEQGVVLGSLFGTHQAPDGAGVGALGDALGLARVRRWGLHTADGQSVVVDDAEHSIRVANGSGSYLHLAPDMVRLHAAASLVLEAPGHSITVRARAVDFEQSLLPDVPGVPPVPEVPGLPEAVL